MHNAHKKASQFIFRHKLWSSIIALIIVVVLYKVITSLLTPASQTVYTIGTASTGTITSSVTGTGQVDISTDVDVPSQTSGAITKVYVSEGQSVKAGDLLATIDPTQNEKAVRDAQANLDSANLSLAKLEEPPTALALSQSQDAITKAQADLATAQQNLKKDYDSGFNSVSNAFLDLPNVMNGLQSMFFDDTISLMHQRYTIRPPTSTSRTPIQNIRPHSPPTMPITMIIRRQTLFQVLALPYHSSMRPTPPLRT
jgi:Biotin-lipoyl like